MSSLPHSMPNPVNPWPWWRRHKIIVLVLVLVLVASALAWWRPWERCGAGMSEVDGQCVGLNLDEAQVWNDDGLNELQEKSRQQNAEALQGSGGEFITVVLLNNLTPDSNRDSTAAENVQHAVAGALAAQAAANAPGSVRPPVRLLIANYGSAALEWGQAVKQIIDHRVDQNIVAVAGLGQSLEGTRTAAAELSKEKIAVVSALASADSMNIDPDSSKPIERFFRVIPSNRDAANAGALYLREQGAKNVLLVSDDNERDIYSTGLGKDFREAYRNLSGTEVPNERFFTSPGQMEAGSQREAATQPYFAQIYDWICQSKPDWIYFAGRGTDLRSFLHSLANGGSCAALPAVKVLTSDDASNLQADGLPTEGSTAVELYYTSVATKDMWQEKTPDTPQHKAEAADFGVFRDRFVGSYGVESDLLDGNAMAHYDAVSLPAITLRSIVQRNPAEAARLNEYGDSTADLIRNTVNCQNPFPGATGKIAFTPERHGDPVNKPMAIMKMHPNGDIEKHDLQWPLGTPFTPQSCG